MGSSFPIVEGFAFIEADDAGGLRRYRWNCSCRRVFDNKDMRNGSWLRNVWSALEAFRQHWASVHPHRLNDINWGAVYAQVPWLTGTLSREDSDNFSNTVGGRILNTFSEKGWMKATVKITKIEEKKGMSRLSDIEARMRELEKEAARYARFPKTDEWPAGTVIVYDQTSLTGELYTYGVLKCSNNKWYWTGRGIFSAKSDADYDHLVEHLAHDRTSNIRIATPEDFDPLFPALTDFMSEEDATKVEAFLNDPSTGVALSRPKREDS